jgi:hypothetical protein
MATTALSIKQEDGSEQRLLFMTTPTENGVDVDIHLADSDFMPTGTPSIGIDKKQEEEYHKQLRKEASEKGQFVKDHSTNPEWNPDYKPEEDVPTVQSDLPG